MSQPQQIAMKSKTPTPSNPAVKSELETREHSDYLYVMDGWVHGSDAGKRVEADPWLKAHKHGEVQQTTGSTAPRKR